jgi:pilus assembly protein CpaE
MDGIKILVIDPNKTSREILVNILNKQNYTIHEAASGRDGLLMINQFTPDLITCDSALKDLSAEAVIAKVRQEISLAQIPIVVFSGHNDPEEMDRYMQSGANDYYGKSGLGITNFIKNIFYLVENAKKKVNVETHGALAVFVSAKGGVGTSSLCANISMELSRLMTKSTIALVDWVLPMGSLSLITGVTDPFNIVMVSRESPEMVTPEYFKEKMIKPRNWPLHFLPGSPDPGAASSFNVNNSQHIIQVLRKAYDYTLVDLGRSFSRISLPIIQEADVIVMVLSNDVSTVELTKRTIDYLLLQNISQDYIYPILNRAVGLEGLSKSEAEKMLGMDIQMTIPYMMSNLTLANNQTTPIATKFPRDPTNFLLQQIAIELSQAVIKHKSDHQAK